MIALRPHLILAAAVLVAFGAGLGGSFHFDDYSIFSDPVLTAPSGWYEVWEPVRTRPLTLVTYWANYQIGGRRPAGYLAVNLALHLCAVLLLWRLLRRLVAERAAFLAALLFAVHPAASEAVLYVFARPALLAAVFALLSAGAWVDGRRWPAVGWFAAALLAKEEVAALPAVLMLLDWSRRKPLRPGAGPLAAMAALAALAALHVIWAAARTPGAGIASAAGITPLEYFAAQGSAIVRYLRLFLVPWGFTIDPAVHASWAAWLVVGIVAAAALRWFGGVGAGFWLLAALVLFLPSSSFFPAADLAADRRMYLPLAAFSTAVALPLVRLRRRYVVAAIAVLAVLSVGRTRVWRTEESLWREAARRSPDKVRPKIQLARALAPADRLPLLRALRAEDPLVASELGRARLELGQPADALAEFGRALALAPRDPQALNNRGVALLALGQAEAARRDFERALSADPCLYEARLNLRRVGLAPPAAACRFTSEQEETLRQAEGR